MPGSATVIDWKIVAQLFTGGVAGAVLTFLLNQYLARKKIARVSVTVSRTDYSIPSRDAELKPVQVSYGGKTFERLLLYELTVRNVSARTAPRSPFLFLLPKDMVIVDRSSTTYPLRRDVFWEEQSGTPGAHLWDPGELKPDDHAVLRLLLTPAGNVDWRFRGDDDARVVAQDAGSAADLETDARLIILWLALFIALGAVPFVSALLRGVLLAVSMPFLVNRILQWRALLATIENRLGSNLNVEMKEVEVGGDFLIENGRSTRR